MNGHEAWLAKALSDLRSAKKLIKDDDDTFDTAVYHTQQCAEKAFKAYLIYSRNRFPKTHDLERLLEECHAIDPIFKQLFADAIPLAPYATYSRYPDDRFCIDRQETEKAIVKAEKILNFVKRMIEDLSHPNMKIF